MKRFKRTTEILAHGKFPVEEFGMDPRSLQMLERVLCEFPMCETDILVKEEKSKPKTRHEKNEGKS